MNSTVGLSLKDLSKVLLIVIVWGFNFIAIHIGLKELPPFLFCAIRFGLSALPFVFFIPKPKAPLKYIFGFGLFNFALQFGLLFSGMHFGLSAGLASLVLQTQVFFSMILAFIFFNEKPSYHKLIGLLISFIGVAVVAFNVGGDVTLIGLSLALLAAFSWASGNIFTKKVNAKSPISLVVWGNLVAFPLMAVTSFFIDGTSLIESSIQHISLPAIGAVFYVVYLGTHLGYSLWGTLLKKYPASTVVPFTLLIPIVGFLGSAFFLKEDLASWKIFASLLIMSGLVFGLLDRKIKSKTPKKVQF